MTTSSEARSSRRAAKLLLIAAMVTIGAAVGLGELARIGSRRARRRTQARALSLPS